MIKKIFEVHMKKFFIYVKVPLIVAGIAAILFSVDCFLGNAIVKGANFMWVAFVSWTIFSNSNLTEKFKALIGNIIGFLCGTAMWHFGSLFNLQLGNLSIASVLGIFLINGIMMTFALNNKHWQNSVSGIFMGMFLTFSGVGVKLYPTTINNALLLLGIILLYSLLGLLCAFLTNFFSNFKITKKHNNTIKTQNFENKDKN